jgi:hypothetical protein
MKKSRLWLVLAGVACLLISGATFADARGVSSITLKFVDPNNLCPNGPRFIVNGSAQDVANPNYTMDWSFGTPMMQNNATYALSVPPKKQWNITKYYMNTVESCGVYPHELFFSPDGSCSTDNLASQFMSDNVTIVVTPEKTQPDHFGFSGYRLMCRVY